MTASKLAERISRMTDEDDVRKACEHLDEHQTVELSMALYDMFVGAMGARKAAEEYETKLLVFTSVVQGMAKRKLDENE